MNHSNIEIELAGIKDVHVLLQFARDTFDNTYRHLNDPEEFEKYLAQNFTEVQFRSELNHPHSAFYFIKVGEDIAGYFKINVQEAQTERHNPDAMEIERIYVHRGFKRMGLGKMMIDKVKSIARKKEIVEIWLGVWEKNPGAIKFYEKQGFVSFGTHVFTIGDDDQTDIMMRLKLDS